MNDTKELQVHPVTLLKDVMASPSVQEQFENALGENKGLFVSSLIDLCASDTNLQECEPKLVVMEALKAATLKLTINKSLGFAYIVPYKKSVKTVTGKAKSGKEIVKWSKKSIPVFQIGYKGMIQLAQRTGIYKHINADPVHEGELVSVNKLSGAVDLSGKKTSDVVVGFFAYIETINGFSKTIYKTVDEIETHGKRYSKAYEYDSSTWQTNFDAMARKTVIRELLSKYGLMSVEMASGFDSQAAADKQALDLGEDENADYTDIDPETGEVITEDPNAGKGDEKETPKADDPGLPPDPGF